jgi:nicotinate-nucleotide adenylyltransferase
MIGILGGTFDPVHYGHLRPALEVQQALGLERVRLIPLGDPPHRDPPATPPAQRLAMLQAAAADEPCFVVDPRELHRSGKSYTLLTLQELREDLGETLPICLLMGSDAFRGFPTWHRPESILRLCHLVVMQRPGEPLPNHYPGRLTGSPGDLAASPGGRILFQTVTQLEISATAIRALVQAGRSPRYLLPDSVLKMIREQGLYGSAGS